MIENKSIKSIIKRFLWQGETEIAVHFLLEGGPKVFSHCLSHFTPISKSRLSLGILVYSAIQDREKVFSPFMLFVRFCEVIGFF